MTVVLDFHIQVEIEEEDFNKLSSEEQAAYGNQMLAEFEELVAKQSLVLHDSTWDYL